MIGIENLLPPALLAASAIRKQIQSAHTPQLKPDQSPVTKADLAAHSAVQNWLQANSPQIPLVSEEADEIQNQSIAANHAFWLLDPLDGTSEFIRGNREYGVSLALIDQSFVQAGVIVAPALGEIAWGIDGQGSYHACFEPSELDSLDSLSVLAFAHQISNKASPLVPPSNKLLYPIERNIGLRVLCSVSHQDQETDRWIESLPNATRVPIGACIKFIRMAQGTADYYPRLKELHEWDIAGGHAILKASGRNMYKLGTQNEVRYGQAQSISSCFECY